MRSDFQLFGCNRAHWVEPFEGERLSFVFFCVSKYWKAKRDVLAQLDTRGFPLPRAEWMSTAETLLTQPRGYGFHQLPKMASLAEIFGQPSPRKVVKRQVPCETSHEKNQPSVIAMLLAAKSHEVPYRCIYGSKGAVKLRGTSSGRCGATTRTCAGNV